jgi:hypothetical protein
MARKQWFAWPAVAAAVVLTGCVWPPGEQFEAAEKGMEAARMAGAQDFEGDELAKLEQEFASAKDEIAKQEQAFVLVRSYRQAVDLLERVARHAKEVEHAVRKKKEAVRMTAESGAKDAENSMTDSKELLELIPSGKERGTWKADLVDLQSDLEAVRALIDKGDYRNAESQAKMLQVKSAILNEDVKQAVAKYNGTTVRGATAIE